MEQGIDDYRSLTPLGIRQTIHRRYSEPPDNLEEMTLTVAAVSPADAVADVGPGNGSFLRRLLESGHQGPVTGLDLSAAAARAVGDIGGAWSVRGDACRIPFGDNRFDVLFARHMLYHVSDVAAALREFDRVLRPDGKCVTVVNHADQAPRLSDLLRRRVQASGVCPPRPSWLDSTTLPSLLESAFGGFSVTRYDGELVFPGPGPVIALAVALLGFYGVGPDSPLRHDLESALASDIHRWFARSGKPWRDVKGFAIFVSASRN